MSGGGRYPVTLPDGRTGTLGVGTPTPVDVLVACTQCGAVVVASLVDEHNAHHDGRHPDLCNCGYGGVHEPANQRCAATMNAANRYRPVNP